MSGATDESIKGGQPCGTWTRKYWRTDFNVAEAIEGPHVPCSSPRLSRVNCGALMGFSFSLLRFLRLPHFCGRRIRLDDLERSAPQSGLLQLDLLQLYQVL